MSLEPRTRQRLPKALKLQRKDIVRLKPTFDKKTRVRLTSFHSPIGDESKRLTPVRELPCCQSENWHSVVQVRPNDCSHAWKKFSLFSGALLNFFLCLNDFVNCLIRVVNSRLCKRTNSFTEWRCGLSVTQRRFLLWGKSNASIRDKSSQDKYNCGVAGSQSTIIPHSFFHIRFGGVSGWRFRNNPSPSP